MGDAAVVGPPLKDASIADQVVADGGPGADAADAAPYDPTWTLPLLKGISLTAMAVDPNGDVYVGGAISDTFSLDAVNISSTQKSDGFVLKLDGKTKKAVWGKVIGGSGNDGIMSMQFQSGAVYVLGTTDSPSVAFAKSTLTIPVAMPSATRSFMAKLDPTDGSDIVTLSPDSFRNANTSFSSFCVSLSVVAKRIAIGCMYSGAGFSNGSPTPPNQSTAIAVLAFDDGFSPNLAWQRALSGFGVFFPNVAVDTNGDVVLSATLRGIQPLIDLVDSSTVLPGQTTQGNPFVLRFVAGTGVVQKSKIWSADAAGGLGAIPTNIRDISLSGNQLFISGQFFGTANFTPKAVSVGGFDGFAMSLDATTLQQNWLATFPGPQQEAAVGIAGSTSGAYVALNYSSPKFTFGKTNMPDAPNPFFTGSIGAVDSKGAPLQAIFAGSVNGSSYVKVVVDAKNLYAIGQFQGATTFDDGTMSTGSLTESNAVVIRRARF